MKERRSRTSRAFRTAVATSAAIAAALLAVTGFAYLDSMPQERATWWAQFLVMAASFGVPAFLLRALMLRRRGTGSLFRGAAATRQERSASRDSAA